MLGPRRHQLQSDGSLVISRVAVEDRGVYTCIAFNGHDRDQRWVQLRVLGEAQPEWAGACGQWPLGSGGALWACCG